MSWRSCSFRSARAQQFTDEVDVVVGPTQSPGTEPGWSLSWSAHLLSLIHTTRASSPALLTLGYPMWPPARGRVSSPPLFLMPSDLAHPHSCSRASSTVLLGAQSPQCCSGQGLRQLSCSHTLGSGLLIPSPSGPAPTVLARQGLLSRVLYSQ